MGSSTILAQRPWIWSFVGALAVWFAAIAYTGGQGAGGMATAALSLAVFTVIVGVGQMFVVALGPGNVDLSLPANIGLASAVAMKVMDGSDAMVPVGTARGPVLRRFRWGWPTTSLIWALRIPPIIATLSASFIIQSIDISYGRGLQIKPPAGVRRVHGTERVVGDPSAGHRMVVLLTIGGGRRAAAHDLRSVGAGHRPEYARCTDLRASPVGRTRFSHLCAFWNIGWD